MTPEQFLHHLQAHATSFAMAVATNEGDWIVKGFIDIYRRIYTISIDTKIVSKVLEFVKFAVDIKSTYRIDDATVNGMTLEAFTGYFRNRDSKKNTLYPYGHYIGHFVLGVIYSKSSNAIDEREQFRPEDLVTIPSVIKDFQFFVQPKFRIASARPGSGNTKNIGSVTNIDQLVNGSGPFAILELMRCGHTNKRLSISMKMS